MLFVQFSKYSISIEIHPRMAWIYHQPSSGICRRWGGVGGQDRWRHGWRHRAPRDGFTACPAHPHRPAKPSTVQSRFGFGRCLKPLRVQGATLPIPLH
ncbi:hypothetical protein B9Y85_12440 [Stenotrophomonas maltophilia]|uniref:Uncharacterized protein n=1 Tax=Stenotrophomonas maltophilia TaxID=40324 RepID=A0A2J0SRR9_STEMA|nr:hypothetical protein [Stenotrophomonas maltophilia]PJK99968.1 hypothetical protein B9Y57_20480 [Stenotrophomonas maltophilia]PJL27876.1 hypothetical protein B9Y65_19825 [Stenotrophomonas maltophilia]PJL62982.1 hypothetical protein B9Y85_12440 [Stenotrophomonas maltophilia]